MGYMYEWLNGLFGTNLSDFLWGYNCATLQYDNGQIYLGIGLVTIAICLLSVALFYFWINHPRWSNRWLPWIIWMGFTCFLNGLVGAIWTVSLYHQGAIGDCLAVYPINCWLFGLANVIVSMILCLVLSFFVKRFSSINTHTPWKSKFWVKNK